MQQRCASVWQHFLDLEALNVENLFEHVVVQRKSAVLVMHLLEALALKGSSRRRTSCCLW